MPNANFLVLYVDDPPVSGRFYSDLLDVEPVEASPTFVMFALNSGLMLGLWSRHTVEPATMAHPGTAELAFTVENAGAVDCLYEDWSKRGPRIAQKPTDLDFGRSFVVLDPDGHRLRVFAPLA